MMRIAFYAPFKPLDHPDPSGDRVIGAGVHDYLHRRGHLLQTASRLRTRWIYWKPWMWPAVAAERRRVGRKLQRDRPDLWLTYHTYYKAPDVLGPWTLQKRGIPYVVFQGIHATKTRRRIKTWPGYILNTRAISRARHVFTNKRVDHINLKRLVPDGRLSYILPGILTEDFRFDPQARRFYRKQWQVGHDPVILSAAMFRPDVKTRGLLWLMETCGALHRSGARFFLVIAGDGKERKRLEKAAETHLPERTRFVGKMARDAMHRFYSAGDFFAFPGINESLGMVYLEAQCCGLPVVAFDNGGIPEVVRAGKTGFLTPMYAAPAFGRALKDLMDNMELRSKMGQAASQFVRTHHDVNRNYRQMEDTLLKVAGIAENAFPPRRSQRSQRGRP